MALTVAVIVGAVAAVAGAVISGISAANQAEAAENMARITQDNNTRNLALKRGQLRKQSIMNYQKMAAGFAMAFSVKKRQERELASGRFGHANTPLIRVRDQRAGMKAQAVMVGKFRASLPTRNYGNPIHAGQLGGHFARGARAV